jgi:predicted DNA binding CopG/RHH family protein
MYGRKYGGGETMAITPRTDRLEIRLSEREREMFDELADRHGLSVAGYVRNLLHSMYKAETEGQDAA